MVIRIPVKKRTALFIAPKGRQGLHETGFAPQRKTDSAVRRCLPDKKRKLFIREQYYCVFPSGLGGLSGAGGESAVSFSKASSEATPLFSSRRALRVLTRA